MHCRMRAPMEISPERNSGAPHYSVKMNTFGGRIGNVVSVKGPPSSEKRCDISLQP